MSRAVVIPTFAASPAPPVSTILLRLVATILARRSTTVRGGGGQSIVVPNQISSTVVELKHHRTLFLQIMTMLGLLVLPQLNCATSASITHQCLVLGADVRWAETRRGGEKRNNTDAERSRGVRAVDRMRIGHDRLVMVVVVVVVVK